MEVRPILGRWLVGFIAFALFEGCNGNDEPLQGANTASGQVGGHSLAVQDTVVALFPGGSGGGRLVLVLSSAAGLCVDYEEALGFVAHKNETRLTLEVHFAGEPAPGAYAVAASASGTTSHATGQFTVVDATCTSLFAQGADDGGTVTISSLTPSDIAGTYRVQFKDGGSLEGTFHRTPCPGLVDRNVLGCK